MLNKVSPPPVPVNRRPGLKGCVAALPMLVAEETVFFDAQELAMKNLRHRQAQIDRVMASGKVGAVVDAMIAREIEIEQEKTR